MRRVCVAFFIFLSASITTSTSRAQCVPVSPVIENYESGTGASAPAYRATAIGNGATAFCENSVAVGASASTSGGPGGGTAVGSLAKTTGPNATALGLAATADGWHSIALGSGSNTGGFASTALGSGARANYDYSVAIGSGAQTTAADQMMFGTSTTSYTLAGLATGASTMFLTVDANGNMSTSAAPAGTPVVDNLSTTSASTALSANQGVILAGLANGAQNVANSAQSVANNAQHLAAAASAAAAQAQTTANGSLQRSGGTMTGTLNVNGHAIRNVGGPVDSGDAANKGYVDQQVGVTASALSALQSDVSDLHQRDAELAEGIAISMAVAAPTFLPGQTFALRVGWGNFDGSTAMGVSAAGIIAKNTFGPGSSVIVDGGFGTGTSQSVSAGRAGLTIGW